MKHSVAIIIFDEEREAVVAFRRKDVSVFVLPGGAIDCGESEETAAIREAKEETGLDVKIIRKVGEYTATKLSPGITHLFVAEAIGGTLQESSESEKVDYYPIKNLPKLFFPIHQTWIEEAKENRVSVIRRELNELSYTAFLRFLLCHPIHVIRFAFAKWVIGAFR